MSFSRAVSSIPAKSNNPENGRGTMTDETDVKKMKVADLKEALKKHGLSTDGLKADLQKRLIDAQDAASASETTPKKVMSKAEKQEALARARLWANKRHTTVADPSTTESVAGEGVVMTEDDPPSSSDRGSRRMAAMRKRRYQAKGSGSDKTVEEEKEVVANDTTTSNVPPPELRSSYTRTSAANQKKTSSGNSRGYLLAIIPIVLLVGASHFLRATISAPPSDYGTGSMFDLIATRYDFINRALALNLDMSWRKRLVQEIVGPQGELFTSTYTNIYWF